MYEQHQALATQPWVVHQNHIAWLDPSTASDRALSQRAAERYALRQALAEQRASVKPQRARRQLGWRRVRRALSRTA